MDKLQYSYLKADIRERINFLKSTASFREVGALTMSSKYVVRHVLKHLSRPLSTVIEYGPGNGVMTKALLGWLSPHGKLLVVESNARFAKALNQLNDDRLQVLHGKAQDLASELIREFSRADAVLLSIPFTFLTPADRLKVVSDAYNMLAPSGTLVIFHQYTPFMFLPLHKIFRSVSVEFEPWNIFPCFILVAKK
ncbi:MAG: rRNA adenine N-6-methyltransferase family protein [bacterium]|nr:rRNA adenine N-6-methyltransferase family protein [bacterium]